MKGQLIDRPHDSSFKEDGNIDLEILRIFQD